MKILCVSDLHGRPAWYEWLVSESSKYDLVCIPGDLLDFVAHRPGPIEQVAVVLSYLREIKRRTSLAICSGNHDVHSQQGLEAGEWMHPLREEGIHVDGDVFSFHGYRFRCVPWCDPLPQNAKEHFWLIHAPPYGVRTSIVAGGVSHGCSELRDVCLSGRGPLFALSGHVHEALGFCSRILHTISLNPGQGDHPRRPSHIVIDMQECTVTHHRSSLTGIKSTTVNFTT